MNINEIKLIAEKSLAGEHISRDEAVKLCDVQGQEIFALIDLAAAVREKFFANKVKFCSIVSGKTGACSEDCNWCAQSSRYQTHIPKKSQQTPTDDILRAAAEAKKNRVACFCMVNSGRRPSQNDIDRLAEVQEQLKIAGFTPACASMGELNDQTARRLAELGVRRYNHNLETSRRYYAKVVSTHVYDDRLATLRAARAAGLELCCGGIFGIGETWEDRVDLAMTLRDEVRPNISPLNFLHPISGTPLAEGNDLTPLTCLKIIAIFRLIMPKADLKIAGGRTKNLRGLQSWIFRAGATSMMIGNYLTTCGQSAEEDLQMVADLGMEPVTEKFQVK